MNKKTAVILFNLGGPEKLEEVRPFLFNLFNDKAIIGLPQPFRFLLAKFISGKREKTAQEIYKSIGNKSPLLDHTLDQADSLEKELSHFGNFKVFISMRYTQPFAQDVAQEVMRYNPTQVILLPLYPQFSTTTSAPSMEDFSKRINLLIKKEKKNIDLKYICCYPQEEEFIKSHSLLIKQTLLNQKSYKDNFEKYRFLFSAHGLPQKAVDAGDPYAYQVQLTSSSVIKNLAQLLKKEEKELDYKICYQSKVGPLKWTQPSLDVALKKTILDKKIPVIIPIAFVSEHSETLAGLDIEYKELAESLGAKDYIRVPALNNEGHFIKSLTKICKSASTNKDAKCFSGCNKTRICPNKFSKCPNFN